MKIKWKQNALGENMLRLFIASLLLGIFLIGCNVPTEQKTIKDPNVTPEGVRITPNVVYGHKFGMALTFDMYQPKNPDGAGVILINSGAWVSYFPNFYKKTTEGFQLLNLEEYDQMGKRWCNILSLLESGFTVFTVRHRSAPKFEMHEIVSDLRTAVRFIRGHADKYGIDADKLGIFGGSSGGHLALLIGTTPETAPTDATEGYEKSPAPLAAIVVYFPVSDLTLFVDKLRGEPNLETLLKEIPSINILLNLKDDQLKEYSPINHVSSNDPPTLIIHGDKDMMVPITFGKTMSQALQNAGVESSLFTIEGGNHGLKNKDDADRAVSEMVKWFKKYLVNK